MKNPFDDIIPDTPASVAAKNPFDDIIPSPTVESGTSAPSGSKEQIAMDYFTSQGWKPHHVTGIVANLAHESGGLNEGILGDSGKSYGLAQWNGPRRKALFEYATSKGEKTPSFMTQLEFVNHELKTSERRAGDILRTTNTLEDATKAFSDLYERPGKPMLDRRLAIARSLASNGRLSGMYQAKSEPPSGDILTALDVGPAFQPGFEMPIQAEDLRPALSGAGAIGGGALGSPLGPGGAVGGAALGYAIMQRLADIFSGKEQTTTDAFVQSGKDLGEGAAFEMGGQAAGKVLSKAAELGGKVVRPILGRLTGTGTGAIEEALKSGTQTGFGSNPIKSATQFDKAMRGEITGAEVVENARDALSLVKDARQAEYTKKLAEISKIKTNIDTKPAWGKIKDLMDRYGVKLTKNGFDTSRVAMGKSGREDIKDILETMRTWGTKSGDNTPVGLDALKRQLDDFYSDSSQARQFVTAMRNIVKGLIVDNVPEYAEMTKGYAEATKLIKDVESGLMMRKQGISGRIVADQTLRRLTSSMRDNFELRRELVSVLSSESGMDISGQVAGHAMSQVLPRGLSGTGPAMIGEAALAKLVHPGFWPTLVASSPRVTGEFLRMYGKALAETKGMSPAIGKALVYPFTIGKKELQYPTDQEDKKAKWKDFD